MAVSMIRNSGFSPSESAIVAAESNVRARSRTPSPLGEEKQATGKAKPMPHAPASQPSASEPRTAAVPHAKPMRPAQPSEIPALEQGESASRASKPIAATRSRNPSGSGRGEKATGRSQPMNAPPSLHPSRASGGDQTIRGPEPMQAASDLHTSGESRGKKAISAPRPKGDAPSSHPSASDGGGISGHVARETHIERAADATHTGSAGACDGHTATETHAPAAVAGDHRPSPLDGASEDVVSIFADWRTRQRWHKAEKSLILQSKAYCRGWVEGGDKEKAGKLYDRYRAGEEIDLALAVLLQPYTEAIDRFAVLREQVEKTMAKTARKLPVYPWVKETFGARDATLAAIVGEAGNVGAYKSVSALWKRMGLAVFSGNRQGNTAGAEDKAATFVQHGYSPARRSVSWNIGNGLIGGMGRGPRLSPGEDPQARDDLSPYQKLFVERCRYECEKDPSHRRPDVVKKDTGEVKESFSKHCASRAKRYVEKRFLRDLYAAWRAAELGEIPT